MNTQNFNQAIGFPFQTETLDEMQKAYLFMQQFGYLAGNFSIISGCIMNNGIVSDGAIFLNGELLEFKGSNLGTDVIIVEVATTNEFEDSTEKDVLYKRHATFGIGSNSIPWANFKKSKNIIQLTEDILDINSEILLKASVSVIDSLEERIEDLEARPQFVNRVKNRGYFTLGDISGGQPVGSMLPFSGDCISAIVAPYIDGGNHYIDVKMATSMSSVNYLVKLYVESLGSINNDNDAGNPIFKIISANEFKVGLYEAGQVVQSIRIHFEVTEL